LQEAGVDFVLVGVGGINFYARTPAGAFATLDLDALLAPVAENLGRALAALSGLGYVFEAGGEPFVDLAVPKALARVVARRVSLNAFHAELGEIDLMTAIAGFAYDELSDDARTFLVEGREVRVGRLEKLLASKQASGRPKDLAFLRQYEAAAGDEPDEG
jgi:hypothetical protein